MMATILLIDDDESLGELLRDFLHGQGYGVIHAVNGKEGLRQLFSQRPDLVLLDVTMPGMDGWSVLKRIREMSDIPVIMLTARDEEMHILRGFSLGADDYITKPFSFAQLGARVKAVLARVAKGNPEEHFSAGDLEVDIPTHRVLRGGEPIHLTPTEFKLLVALMKEEGRVVTSEALARQVWGAQYATEVGFVRRYIWHLRQKLEPDPDHPRYIHNERGIGYRFAAQEDRS
jgi:two-component system KDP operon response regulator KdpE